MNETDTNLTVLPKKDQPLEVDVPIEAIPEPTVTDAEAIEALRRCGLANIGANAIRDLAAIGIHAKGVGVLRQQRGRAMVSQHKLDQAVNILLTEMNAVAGDAKVKNRVDKLVRLGNGIGFVTGKITESQRLAIEIESMTVGSGAPVGDKPEMQQGFAPKAKIQPGTTIHAQNVFVAEKKS